MTSNGGGKPVRCGVVGYGTVANFGKAHAFWIQATEGLELAAICDAVDERLEAAEADYPGVATYSGLDALLADADVDMVTLATPNNTHAPLAIQCLSAGKHVIVEKPMCLSVEEGSAMMAAAEQSGTTLTVFFNRRNDGNYRAIKQTIDDGKIGDVFSVEFNGYGPGYPAAAWRNRKEVSGGLLYAEIVPHAVDWVLELVGSRVSSVTAFSHKFLGEGVTNEDHARVVLRFDNGVVGQIVRCRAGWPLVRQPDWRILGTRGAIVDTGAGAIQGYPYTRVGPSGGSFRMVSEDSGEATESDVPYAESTWGDYYDGIARHLRHGDALHVTAADGRRAIAITEAAQTSARTGETVTPIYR